MILSSAQEAILRHMYDHDWVAWKPRDDAEMAELEKMGLVGWRGDYENWRFKNPGYTYVKQLMRKNVP